MSEPPHQSPHPVSALQPKSHLTLLAYIALFATPMFFSTNVIFGRLASDIAPFTLAFLRWSITATVLLIVCHRQWRQMLPLLVSQWKVLLFLGFLGMFICGGFVYLALHTTSATNGILIYTTPPIFILVIERVWKGRTIKWREIIGVSIAIVGVGEIVSKGSMINLLNLVFTPGDLLFLLAAFSWAIYSVLLKNKSFSAIGTLPLFALIAVCGATVLLPAAAFEFFSGQPYPVTSRHWGLVAGIVILSSLISYSTFQFGVKIVGSSIAGIFMYLLPPFGVSFAWLFLHELFLQFHAIGIATILGGVILATFPERMMRRIRTL